MPRLFFVLLLGLPFGLAWTLSQSSAVSSGLAGDATSPTPANVVEMAPSKRRAADLATARVELRALRPHRIVPGRLKYDERRHVEVATSAAGFVKQIHAVPGDTAVAGQVLAVISSPEVGAARADVLQRTAECDVAERVASRAVTTHEAVLQLADAIAEGRPIESLGHQSEAAALGAYGNAIVSAYADFLVAQQLHQNVEPIAQRGVVSGRLLLQRRIAENKGSATLKAALESSLFDSDMDRLNANNVAADAHRRLQVSRERLASLLGYQEDPRPDYSQGLSLFEVRAPFQGVVEAIHRSAHERISEGAALMTFANTDQLWASADIREPEWAALDLSAGDEVSVTVPVVEHGCKPLQAIVHYVGRQVSPQTNAVPLVATIDNCCGRLRPGQFVRVRLPLADPKSTLAVPEAAVLEDDQVRFVFVELEQGVYRRADVTTGLVDDGWTEVVSGLSEGERVVTQGAFALKSEQLLETNAED